jgi:hypothetical protein
MRRTFYFLFIIGMLFASFQAVGQKTVVVVEPDEGIDIGALNSAISGAADPDNTIFELKREGLYLLNGSISHADFTLHIRAEEGDGPRPVLQPAVDEQGNSSRHFNPGGNLILEGLYLQGRSELGAIESQPIRVSGADSRIILDNCFVDYAGQSIVRMNSSGNKVYIRNSIVRNSLLPTDPANGRTLDTRGNPQDTLSIENTTIYNNGARIIRPDGAEINHIQFNHNTVFQVSFTQDFPLDITKTATITNNIFYNFAYRANNKTHSAFFSADSIGEGASYTDADRYFDFRNNNFYQQAELANILAEYDPGNRYFFNSWDEAQQDTIWFEYVMRSNVFYSQAIMDTAVRTLPPVLYHFIMNGQAETSNNFSEELHFDNPPPLNLEYWQFFVENDYSIIGTNPPNAWADENPDVLGEVSEGAYSFRYNGDAKSATAASDGKPLGDPRWVPLEIPPKEVVVVEPDEGIDIGALNSAISNAENPGNTIFELKRGGLYLLNGSISHSGYTLHIRAEEGDGPRPVLQPAVDEQGNSSRHFNPGGSLTLESLYLQGRGELGSIESQPIRVSGDESEIIIDDCFIDYAGQSIVRTNSSGNKVMISNSIIRNSILPTDPANGRVIDTRGNPQDVLSIENSTIYNNGSRIFRPDGAAINLIKFNHNTVYQVSFVHDFGLDVTKEAQITNNIFYNHILRASKGTHSSIFAVDSIGEGGPYTDAERHFDFRNNNHFIDPEFGSILEEFDPTGLYQLRTNIFADPAILDTAVVIQPPTLLHFIAAGQADTLNNFREHLRFDNPPPPFMDYWKFYVENSGSLIGTNPPSPFADEDPNVLGEVTEGAYTFSYNDDARSATAATGGLPLGDPRWAPYSTVSVRNPRNPGMSAASVFPNPFTDVVNLAFDSRSETTATIRIIDMIGREIIRTTQNVNQGTNTITLNLGEVTQQGIYLYQIHTDRDLKPLATGKIVRR